MIRTHYRLVVTGHNRITKNGSLRSSIFPPGPRGRRHAAKYAQDLAAWLRDGGDTVELVIEPLAIPAASESVEPWPGSGTIGR